MNKDTSHPGLDRMEHPQEYKFNVLLFGQNFAVILT
jgi:hypothetical protein